MITREIPIAEIIRERVESLRRNTTDSQVNMEERREETLKNWQKEWRKDTGKASWTMRLIKNVIEWYRCEFKNTSYFFTQFLSGHGAFSTYIKRIKRTEDESCLYCGDYVFGRPPHY